MRAVSVNVRTLAREQRRELRLGVVEEIAEYARPKTRSECENGERPCPFAGCRFHLFIDVSPSTGTLKMNFPDLELWELRETCALDVADRDGVTLDELAEVINLTRERVRQIEWAAIKKLMREPVLRGVK